MLASVDLKNFMEMFVVIITGGSGFLGQAIAAKIHGAQSIGSKDLDLTIGSAVLHAFQEWKPTVVVHLAARVGGITENIAKGADFLIENTLIDANVLSAVRAVQPDHFIPMLSTCMYPDELSPDLYPMPESRIEDGPPPPTNAAYAAAKRTLWHGTRALHAQYGVPFSALIPANLYGPGDHFGEARSHFIAAAIAKIEQARRSDSPTVAFFGTGRALRQYVYVDDVAEVVACLIRQGPANLEINIAPTVNRSIRDLAAAVSSAVGYQGEIVFSGKGPDGQHRKDVSTERLVEVLPEWDNIETDLQTGLRSTVNWYRNNVATR